MQRYIASLQESDFKHNVQQSTLPLKDWCPSSVSYVLIEQVGSFTFYIREFFVLFTFQELQYNKTKSRPHCIFNQTNGSNSLIFPSKCLPADEGLWILCVELEPSFPFLLFSFLFSLSQCFEDEREHLCRMALPNFYAINKDVQLSSQNEKKELTKLRM